MNKIRTFVLQAFLVLIPIWYIPTFDREIQERAFQFATILIVAAFVGNMWLGLFMALNVVLFLENGAKVGLSQVMNIMFGLLIFMFSRYYFKANKFDTVYKPTLIVLCITLIWMVFQLFHIDPLFQPQSNGNVLLPGPIGDPSGFFGIKEANGTFITLCMPILATINPILSLLLLIPIYKCEASTVYLAAVVITLFYTFYLHRKVFKVLCITIPILAGFFIIKDIHTDPMTFNSRFPVWIATTSYALKHPQGYGPDSFRNRNKYKDFNFVSDSKYKLAIERRLNEKENRIEYYSVSHDINEILRNAGRLSKEGIKNNEFAWWDSPHNMYIDMLFQYGIIGVLLMVGFLYELWYRFKHAIKDRELIVITSCILVYFVTGIGHFPLNIARTAYLFPILLGGFFAKTDEI